MKYGVFGDAVGHAPNVSTITAILRSADLMFANAEQNRKLALGYLRQNLDEVF